MTKNEEFYLAKDAIIHLEKAREIIDKIEESQGGYVMGDSLSELIEALEYVGIEE